MMVLKSQLSVKFSKIFSAISVTISVLSRVMLSVIFADLGSQLSVNNVSFLYSQLKFRQGILNYHVIKLHSVRPSDQYFSKVHSLR